MPRRICLTLDWQSLEDRERIFRQVEIADKVGVDTVWIAEAWGRDAFSLLTQLAERTKRIGLGTGIVNIYSRTPAALAQHFATLDELSGGRAIAGFGTSGPQVIEHFHGIKGTADLASNGRFLINGQPPGGKRTRNKEDAYQLEHDTFFENIRTGKVRNDAEYAAHSSMMGVMGRMATYTGQVITWEQAFNSTESLVPDNLTWNTEPPVKPDADGWYPVAIPGTTVPV